MTVALVKALGLRTLGSNEELLGEFGDGVVWLAVKPQVLPKLAKDGLGSARLLVSILAGTTISTIHSLASPARPPVIRVMPNAPAVVGKGMSVFASSDNATEAQVCSPLLSRPVTESSCVEGELVSLMMGTVGEVVEVEEGLIDAVTGISGSGPAFVSFPSSTPIPSGSPRLVPFPGIHDPGGAVRRERGERDPAGPRGQTRPPDAPRKSSIQGDFSFQEQGPCAGGSGGGAVDGVSPRGPQERRLQPGRDDDRWRGGAGAGQGPIHRVTAQPGAEGDCSTG